MKFSGQILALTLVFIFSIFCFSQNKIENNEENKSANKHDKTVLIKTSILILEANGQLANDVKAEDLKVFEDGVEQKNISLNKISSVNVGVVVDNTGSVRTQLKELSAVTALIFNNMRENDEAFLVRFVSSDKIEIMQDWTSNKAELNEALENMYVEEGQSAVLDAVYLAAENIAEKAKKDETKRNVLIVISDWEDRASFYKRKEVLKKVKQSNVEIYTVAFVQQLPDFSLLDNKAPPRERASDLADLFARETSGAVYFPKISKKKPNEIVETAQDILSELRSQYVIEYVSSNQKSGDKNRKLRVEVADGAKGEKRTAILRQSVSISND